jgi:hypothetical protein
MSACGTTNPSVAWTSYGGEIQCQEYSEGPAHQTKAVFAKTEEIKKGGTTCRLKVFRVQTPVVPGRDIR